MNTSSDVFKLKEEYHFMLNIEFRLSRCSVAYEPAFTFTVLEWFWQSESATFSIFVVLNIL
jgi:hypothetical protein